MLLKTNALAREMKHFWNVFWSAGDGGGAGGREKGL